MWGPHTFCLHCMWTETDSIHHAARPHVSTSLLRPLRHGADGISHAVCLVLTHPLQFSIEKSRQVICLLKLGSIYNDNQVVLWLIFLKVSDQVKSERSRHDVKWLVLSFFFPAGMFRNRQLWSKMNLWIQSYQVWFCFLSWIS